jgi:hypothetical protein
MGTLELAAFTREVTQRRGARSTSTDAHELELTREEVGARHPYRRGQMRLKRRLGLAATILEIERRRKPHVRRVSVKSMCQSLSLFGARTNSPSPPPLSSPLLPWKRTFNPKWGDLSCKNKRLSNPHSGARRRRGSAAAWPRRG